MFIIRMHQFMSSARFYRPTTSIEMMWPFQDSASSSRIHQMKNGNMLKNWWNTKIREEGVSFSKTSKYVCPLQCLRKLRLQYTFRNCAFVAFSVFKGFILYFCLFVCRNPTVMSGAPAWTPCRWRYNWRRLWTSLCLTFTRSLTVTRMRR